MKTTTIWKSGEKFESTYKHGRIETSPDEFSPKALLLAGLAGCSGIDVVMILEKMRVPFADLQIDVETEQTDTPPKVFKDIHMVFMVKTSEENREKVIKAIDLSLEKYCGVAAMLQKNSRIDYKLQILPE
jgi:putative redox protein